LLIPQLQVKALFVFVGEATLLNKILAALTTGVVAISVANPTDLVKVRLQANGKSTAGKRHYSGALNAYATIIKQVLELCGLALVQIWHAML
jgi:solute carrier family 25 uncoupling protein 8/9